MGLYTWNKPLDPYDYVQLTLNWNKVDYHDHTPGRGTQIPAGGIAPGAIGPLELNFTASQIGSWVSLVPDLATGLVAASGYNVPSARLEGDNDVVRLKGVIENTSGASITNGTTLFTLPSQFAPSIGPVLVCALGASLALLEINPSGAVTLNAAFPNTTLLYLDGLTYTLS